MNTIKLKRVDVSDSAIEWLKSCYSAVDSMNSEGYRSFLAEECILSFGNNSPVQCNNEIIGGIVSFWNTISGLEHWFINVYGDDHSIVLESIIDYTRKDLKIVQVPCVTIIDRNSRGLSTSVRIFIDVTIIYK